MTAKFIWDNVVAYSLQIGLLVALSGFVPSILRLRLPGARLAYWHLLLAACLLLPMVGPRTREADTSAVQISTTIAVVTPAQPAGPRGIPRSEMALLLLAAGAAIRLGWLGAGFWRLRQYRRRSRPLEPATVWNAEADLRISDCIASPVTFGFRKPVVLLPARFPALDARIQEAILCHEILHVRRRDWLFTVAEELVRAMFWFHPAIWWLLGEIGLAREQAVDREVIGLTRQRDEYLDALLAIAGAKPQLDLAPAPLFLRKRHLKQRVVSILKEVRMSKMRLVSALTAALGILAAACWFVTVTFPLAAAPQAPDGPGVTVDMAGASVMHRTGVPYPVTALKQGVQGTVAVELTTDSSGNVSDARVLSGPVELRKAAIQSVLQWHLMKDMANSTRQVRITFQLPAAGENQTGQTATFQGLTYSTAVLNRDGATPEAQAREAQAREAQAKAEARAKALAPSPAALPAPVAPFNAFEGKRIARIIVAGLPDQAREDLLSQLPVHEGDLYSRDLVNRTFKAVHDFDEHLIISIPRDMVTGDPMLQITAPGVELIAGQPAFRGGRGGVTGGVPGGVIGGVTDSVAGGVSSPAPGDPKRLTIGGNVQQAKLIYQPKPVYPPEAKAQRIQGVVKLQAVIGTDGHVKDLLVISGHPLLVASALEAVKQWVYQDTHLNGEPVEVQTVIDVNYTLSQ